MSNNYNQSFSELSFNIDGNFTTQSSTTPSVTTTSATLAWLLTTGTLCIIGITANILVLLAFRARTRLRQGSGIIIIHLTVLYLLLCGVHVPIALIMALFQQLLNSPLNVSCRYVQFGYLTSIFIANWTDAILAVNRLIAMCFPHKYAICSSKWVIGVMLALCWVFSLALSFSLFFNVCGKFVMLPSGMCAFKSTCSTNVTLSAMGTYLPYGVIGAASVIMCVRMLFLKCKTPAIVNQGGSVRTNAVSQRRWRNARMILMSFLWVFICNATPAIITSLFRTTVAQTPVASFWVRTCSTFQYSLTPIIYFGMNSDYRGALVDLGHKCGFRNRLAPRIATTGTGAS